jgi:hypothetical protein
VRTIITADAGGGVVFPSYFNLSPFLPGNHVRVSGETVNITLYGIMNLPWGDSRYHLQLKVPENPGVAANDLLSWSDSGGNRTVRVNFSKLGAQSQFIGIPSYFAVELTTISKACLRGVFMRSRSIGYRIGTEDGGTTGGYRDVTVAGTQGAGGGAIAPALNINRTISTLPPGQKLDIFAIPESMIEVIATDLDPGEDFCIPVREVMCAVADFPYTTIFTAT